MKLKRFLKYYPRDKFLRLCLLNNSEEKVYFSLDKVIYSGYAENVPFKIMNYKIKFLLPNLKTSAFESEEEDTCCTEGILDVFIYEKRGEEDCT